MAYVNLIDIVYPVGSVYQSYNATSPSTLFGGSWSQITGRFLRGGNDTATGGGDWHFHYFGWLYDVYYSGLCTYTNANPNRLLAPANNPNCTVSASGVANMVIDNDGNDVEDKFTFYSSTVSAWQHLTNANVTGSRISQNPTHVVTIGPTSYEPSLPSYQNVYTWYRTK